ncbi:MAG: hypothetical protein JNL38_27635 [Myxococcales bacterium]|nr:hypothetical protein [Myxococcales bacterium]
MSLIVTGLVLASGVILGRLIAGGLPRKKAPEPDAKRPEDERKTEGDPEGSDADGEPGGAPADAKSDETKKKKKEPQVPKESEPAAPLDAFPCKLGDVVLRDGGDEAWLAGVLVLSEEEPMRALYFAPEAGKDVVVLATPRPESALTWLSPIDPGVVLTRGEPPSSIEHEGLRFERYRRLPLRVSRFGSGAPDFGAECVVAEYRAAGPERLLVVVGGGSSHAYRGVSLEEGMYEILPSGRATLD